MPGNFYEKPEFIKLQKEWYGKLRDSGFNDIEYRTDQMCEYDAGYLQGISVMDIKRLRPGWLEFSGYVKQWYWWRVEADWWVRKLLILWEYSEGESWTDIAKKVTEQFESTLPEAYNLVVYVLNSKDPKSEIGQMLHAVRHHEEPFRAEDYR